jgi:hypothetical protein
LTKIQRGVYYSGTILFNALPIHIKKVAHNIKKTEARTEEISLGKIFLLCEGIS